MRMLFRKWGRELGALPLPVSARLRASWTRFAGEGWGGGESHESLSVPPPYPSPASGGGDAAERVSP